MARLRTWGYEVAIGGIPGSSYNGSIDAAFNGAGSTRQSTIVRSGGWALKCDTGATGVAVPSGNIRLTSSEAVLGRTYFGRNYMRFENIPSATRIVVLWRDTANTLLCSARLTSAGKLILWNDVAGSQIGSDSAETIVAGDGKWHRVELACKIDTGSVDTAALRLNGIEVASATGLALSDTVVNWLSAGWVSGTGDANQVIYLDDGAINDDQGTDQNAFPGEGKVVALFPISDNARDTKWTTNAGTTTTNFNAVDNTPPVGIAANTTPDNSYEKHAGTAAGTTDRFDANMTTYTTAGLVSTDKITLVQGVLSTGEEVTTGSKLVSFECLSNPVIASTGSFDVAPTTNAQGTWPTNWWTKWGPATYNPTPTLGTSPVMRVIRPETATRVASVAFMGLYAEYVNAGKAPPPFQNRWRYLPRRVYA